MSNLKIYGRIESPPTRFAFVVAKHVGVDPELVPINFIAGEHFSPQYRKINPTSLFPTLVDGDNIVGESCAISIYLVKKYGKDDSLYPEEFVQNCKVNEMLFFVSSTVFPDLKEVFVSIMFHKASELSEVFIKRFLRTFDTVETILMHRDFLAGPTLTLPDIFLWCSIESLIRLYPIDSGKYPRLSAWLERMQQDPSNDYQQEGANMITNLDKMMKERRKSSAD